MAGFGRHNGRNGGRTVVCLAALLLLVLNSACTRPPSPASSVASEPVSLTIGVPVQTGKDPLYGASQVSRLLNYEGLTFLARDGRPQPRLAERWTESPDGLTWTIHLRNNAFFHDGTRVDAASVKASLERSLKSVNRDRSPGLKDVLSIEAPSNGVVVIHLSARSTFLLEDLTVSIDKPGADGPIGTGPFVITSTADNELVMSSVTSYYRGKPAIDRIVWRSYPALRTAWAAMMRGEIDFLYEVPPGAVEFIEPEGSVQVFPFLRNYVYLVVFNSRRQPFADPRVRNALNYAIDRERLIDQALGGRGQQVSGPVWPLHWAYDASVPAYSYDPSRASALLDAATIPPLRPSDRAKAPGRFHFTCLLPENFAVWERMALILQRDLAAIGVDMQIESVSFETWNDRIGKGDFDAVIGEMIVGNAASRPFTFWSTNSTQNTSGYSSPSLDKALDQLRRAPDTSAYRAAFRQVQVESLEDPPAIFLALGQVTRAVSKRFQVVAATGSDIYASLSDWRPAPGFKRSGN
jgi:peptide/nickel transport system substrate-binding protein